MGITDLRQFEKERGVYVAAELNVVGAGGVRYHKFNRIMSIKVGLVSRRHQHIMNIRSVDRHFLVRM